MSKTTAVINEGFYTFVQERQSKTTVARIKVEESDLYYRFAPVIPKVTSVITLFLIV